MIPENNKKPLRDTYEAKGKTRGKVVIEVMGGVAYMKSKPRDIEVIIIDYDSEQ